VGAFQDGDVGASRQKLVHKGKVPMCYTDRLSASVSGRSPIIQKYPLYFVRIYGLLSAS
jgi:hypothetical protein